MLLCIREFPCALVPEVFLPAVLTGNGTPGILHPEFSVGLSLSLSPSLSLSIYLCERQAGELLVLSWAHCPVHRRSSLQYSIHSLEVYEYVGTYSFTVYL